MSHARPVLKFAAPVALLCAVLLLSGCGINTIPAQKQAVNAAWSQVLNEYQRRTDLIPNLVATVKGSAEHETDVLEAVTNARAKVTQTQIPADILTNPKAFHEFEQNQATLGGALSRLISVTENYPDLKANQNYLVLQAQLEGTENRIAVARRDYILAVQQYDTTLTTIPGRWYHSMFYSSYLPVQNFTISEQAQQAPKVNFSGTP
ncbi:MAG: LemA family protein [Gammaproteobacteria bacterium]|nr:LemA family protein [Gammaproteobacteria bacterium]MDE1888354.1 LemA family protein [Gammaproteobacteria bacterium]MDE2024194.1 LemA family protein [Gammaproteobacteria bacterium]MDE2140726.1 LemA family protein [Gammaproteobacteria bacterium]MDE2274071.1 LemA family protein [Gammaproteobacteria bacterium]